MLWIHEPKPNRLQHWYVPVFAAAGGGLLSEAARTFITFAKVGARLSWQSVGEASGIGILEGVFVALVFGAGYGLAGLVRPRFAKRAT